MRRDMGISTSTAAAKATCRIGTVNMTTSAEILTNQTARRLRVILRDTLHCPMRSSTLPLHLQVTTSSTSPLSTRTFGSSRIKSHQTHRIFGCSKITTPGTASSFDSIIRTSGMDRTSNSIRIGTLETDRNCDLMYQISLLFKERNSAAIIFGMVKAQQVEMICGTTLRPSEGHVNCNTIHRSPKLARNRD